MDPRVLKQLGRLVREYDHACRSVKEERTRLVKARSELVDAQEGRALLQAAAAAAQAQAHYQISALVTRCLKAVFGEEGYEFGLAFERKRGRTEARFFLKRGELEIDDLRAEAGGGVVDVAALALRLAALLLSTPRRRRLLILDEPFKNINGREFQKQAATLLLTLSEEMGVQMIIVTDDEWLKVGEVTEL